MSHGLRLIQTQALEPLNSGKPPMKKTPEAEEYHSKDFEWNDLKTQIENDPSLSYHLLPFDSLNQNEPPQDSQAWSRFHSRHSSGHFFKERRYLLKEFPELLSCGDNSKVLEIGCGSGSTVLPILRGNKNVIVYACDCSAEALQTTKEFVATLPDSSDRFHSFLCDFSNTGFPKWLACNSCQEMTSPERQQVVNEDHGHSPDDISLSNVDCCIGGVDFITLIFTLSAVPLHQMPQAINECYSVLKPGGLILFRDYGLYDMTMLRFEPDKRVGFREYMRPDGTRSYFYDLNTVRSLFIGAGFIEVELEYCCVKSVNRRKGKIMERVWVHGKFQKPV